MSENTPPSDTRDPNAAEPSANERGESARAWIGWFIAIVVLPMLYVLSCGPAVWVTLKFNLNPAFLEVAYRPIDWAYQNTPLQAPIRWYVELWHPS